MEGVASHLLKQIQCLLTKIQDSKAQGTNRNSRKKRINSSKSAYSIRKNNSVRQIKTTKQQIKHAKSILQPEQVSSNNVYHKMSYRYIKNGLKKIKKQSQTIVNNTHMCSDFKVTNKRSLHLINKQKRIPIYSRVQNIINHKKCSVEKIKKNLEQEQLFNRSKQIKKHDLRYLQLLQDQNKDRIFRINSQRLNLYCKNQEQKSPSINKSSVSLRNNRNKKNNFSQNVFIRLQQENEKTKKHLLAKQKERKQIQTPFRPTLSVFQRNKSTKYLKRAQNIENEQASQNQKGKKY